MTYTEPPGPNAVGFVRGQTFSIVREGIIAGLIGAAAVAVWFLIFDVLLRQAFFTPAALGSALFHGAAGPEEVRVNARTVLGYTAVHVTVWALLGIMTAAFAQGAQRQPPLVLGFILVFTTLATHLIGVLVLFWEWILNALGSFSVLVGTLIGATATVFYIWKRNPGLRRAIQEDDMEAAEHHRVTSV